MRLTTRVVATLRTMRRMATDVAINGSLDAQAQAFRETFERTRAEIALRCERAHHFCGDWSCNFSARATMLKNHRDRVLRRRALWSNESCEPRVIRLHIRLCDAVLISIKRKLGRGRGAGFSPHREIRNIKEFFAHTAFKRDVVTGSVTLIHARAQAFERGFDRSCWNLQVDGQRTLAAANDARGQHDPSARERRETLRRLHGRPRHRTLTDAQQKR